MRGIDLAHIRRLVFSVLFGSFCILGLLAVLGGVTRAAPLDSPGTGLDPEIRYITMTSHLPLYDPTGGEGITKTVFFNNTTGGVITLTFEISGTPALTLTAGAAFGDAAQTYTSIETPWLQEVAYSVEAGGGDYPGVAYTVTNSDGQQATVVITYIRDIVGPYHMYLPFVTRNYRLLVNGDFEDELRGWNTERGPFSGHGSGLPQSVVVFDGDNRALLGERGDLPAGSIPVGYGTISQTFRVNKPYLQLQYWVFSYDIAKGPQRYYDTLEVSVNRSPAQISNTERDSRGCASTVLNPEGTLTVSGDGLVFCGGRPGISGGTRWDTKAWKTVTLDVGAFQGTDITLYLAIWSREHDAPDWDDSAWFNTWAYIDNIQLDE